MEAEARLQFFDEVEHDISEFLITGHAMSQYSAKCTPGLTLIELSTQMRQKMKKVRKVELNKKKRLDRVSYIDEDEVIYITDRDKVITVFPNERIFIAKTVYSNKKTGKKYL
jgi:predicted RNase H-like nuclease